MRAYTVQLVVYTNDANSEEVQQAFTMLQLPCKELEVAEVVQVTEVTDAYVATSE